jgi:hypothetical protein
LLCKTDKQVAWSDDWTTAIAAVSSVVFGPASRVFRKMIPPAVPGWNS